MFKINRYYDDKVMSLGFEMPDGPASVGVMAPGEYEFTPSVKEILTVTSGVMSVRLSGSDGWRDFGPGETFTAGKGQTFKAKLAANASYLCLYR
ncbi:MAG TPA: pyrimidine/purine nucleoside phosphorylase [Phycisphaerae bacterium]|nr:pyrimidine/purine nucleoside phosphorylase [Phycisphaerae bacterium]